MQGLVVTAAMVIAESFQVGLNTLIKVAITKGMSNFLFIFYANVTGLIFLLPSTFIFHRNRAPPKITISIICKLFVLGTLRFGVQTLTYTGIEYGSPTLATAMMDLNPAFTFILAIISRMEKLDLKKQSSQAKSLGTVISIVGALIVAFCKGTTLNGPLHSQQSDWVIAGFLLAAASFLLSILLIFQAIFLVTIRNVVSAWGCRTKGPVFFAMFQPLGIVIALVMGVAFLGDTLYLGRLIGAAIITIGFYAVIWGQAKEEKIVSDESGISSSVSTTSRAPLLQNSVMET
ncbi:WAT1-related protein [Quillaja saponaria]|uniref:WAT1-related protein n=1 Tax=Quillaja saponaria TaxID=32244 RepID=A0AAD7L8L5_QUISA|nr:WAT1-related protein [Quillaja saponaria]